MKIFHVDAFTDKPFFGNPAGVCILPEGKDDDWMKHVGGEMNLSETAFLLKRDDGYSLRWFTPKVEVDLCGHATLASAHVLWEAGYLARGETARFHTRSGLLTSDRKGTWIELNFPSKPEEPAEAPENLVEALGVQTEYVGKNNFDYIIEVASEEIVRGARPDFVLLEKVAIRGVIITSRATSKEYDFVSRFFAPRVGVNEDPVTGSAHCCLGPFWQKRLHKDEFVAYQASERGGIVKVRVHGDRIFLMGQAVTVLSGELHS
jgi:PhzF family phenazine biosynthesis protein